MAKAKKETAALSYAMRPPGRPKKSEAAGERAGVQKEEPGSLRFEMRLPPGVVADLELMRERTGNTYAGYIRTVVLRALAEDKKCWGSSD